MAELVAATFERIEKSEAFRTLALTAFAVMLALVFLALLVGDQVTAATY